MTLKYLASGHVLSDTRINPTTVLPRVDIKWFGSGIIPNHNCQFIPHHDDKPWKPFLHCRFFVRMNQHYYRKKPSTFQSYHQAIYPKTQQMNAENLKSSVNVQLHALGHSSDNAEKFSIWWRHHGYWIASWFLWKYKYLFSFAITAVNLYNTSSWILPHDRKERI